MQVKSKILIVGAILLLNLWWPMATEVCAQKTKSTSIIKIGDESFYVHTVAAGETIYSLSKLYGVSENDIVAKNPQISEGLRPAQVLKIKVVSNEIPEKKLSDRKQAKIFDQHIVNKGETAYSICKRYGLPLTTLLEDNVGLDPTALSLGQKLNIRKNSVGGSEPHQIEAQLEDYRDATNKVSNNYKIHLVAKGETLYSLSKLYSVGQNQISRLNNLTEGLKVGMMIKIPTAEAEAGQNPTIDIVENKIDSSNHHIPGDSSKLFKNPNEGSDTWKAPIPMRIHKSGDPINVAILLPLQTGSTHNRSFLEFYQGTLIALEDLKSQGINIEVGLYNSGRSAHEVAAIVDERAFNSTDIIVGPIYEECFEPVVSFAEKHGIAVVSPLANMERTHSPIVYQLSPKPSTKYDKLKGDLTEEKNVVVISMSNNDTDFEREISAILPHTTKRFNYSKDRPVTELESLISSDKENIFVVLSGNESSVDEFLARISSVQNNLLARSIKSANIKIIGTSRWLKFQNIDKNLYFKLGLNFVTLYHADRSNAAVISFDKRYISAFGSLPSLYAYRGYDAMKLFVGTLDQSGGNDLTNSLNNTNISLLQMPYRFVQEDQGNNVNQEWAVVKYNGDYTIEVK